MLFQWSKSRKTIKGSYEKLVGRIGIVLLFAVNVSWLVSKMTPFLVEQQAYGGTIEYYK